MFLPNENTKPFSHTSIFLSVRRSSPHNKIGLNCYLTKISHIEIWRVGPVSRQLFREAEFLVGFEEVLYTILSLVLLTDSLMTDLCNK